MARRSYGPDPWTSRESLSDGLIDSLPPPVDAVYRIKWDGDPHRPGLGIRVTKSGARAYVCRYHIDGRVRVMTIGTWRKGTLAAAIKRYNALRDQIDAGTDPLAKRHERREAPTVNDLADRFEREHMPKLRESTAVEYRAMIRTLIRPALGKVKVADVAYAHVDKLHREIAARTPYRANRCLAVLSKMLSLAVRWQYRADSPTLRP
jgi:hypothetical protein